MRNTSFLMSWIGIACILSMLVCPLLAAPQKMPITFSGYTRSETLTNFPVLVVFSNGMSAGYNYSQYLCPSGFCQRFYNADMSSELNYEIESWNTNGASYVWVQVPALTSTTTIWVTWGDPANVSQKAYTTNGATWNTDFTAVYHMTETNGLVKDSTVNKFNATAVVNPAQITATNGLSNGGLNFVLSGTNAAYITTVQTNALDYTNNMTLSVWANAAPYNIAASDYASALGTFTDVNIGWVFARRSTSGNIMVFDAAVWRDSGVAWPTGRWSQVVYTKTGTNGYVYVDGALASTAFQVAASKSSVNPVYIAAGGPGRVLTNHVWKGGLDEIRITHATETSNEIWAAYQTAASNSAFESFGAVSDLYPSTALAIVFNGGSLLTLGASTAAPLSYWDDPFSNSLAFNYRGSPAFTNGAGQVLDYGPYSYLGSTNGAVNWVPVGTNIYGRVTYAIDVRDNSYFTNGAPDVVGGCTALTMSAWIKTRTLNSFGNIMSSHRSLDYFLFGPYGGSGIEFRPSSTCYAITSAGILTTNTWIHLVCTWSKDVNAGVPFGYVNGVLASTPTTSARTTTLQAMGVGMVLGNDQFDLPNRSINGLMTNVKMYTNLYMSAVNVTNQYNNTNPTNDLQSGY